MDLVIENLPPRGRLSTVLGWFIRFWPLPVLDAPGATKRLHAYALQRVARGARESHLPCSQVEKRDTQRVQRKRFVPRRTVSYDGTDTTGATFRTKSNVLAINR